MADLKVYIRPEFAGPDQGEGGIRRWVEMQHKYLPEYGILPVDSEDAADLVACHAGDLVPTRKPLVCHNHGLYNTANQEWSRWAWALNGHVVELLRRADIATVPSEWVRMQVARGMAINPRVMYAGIEPELWHPTDKNNGYVLWNKTRVDPVCDPLPLNVLARRNANVRFMSTFGDAAIPNLQLTGKLPFDEAREIVRYAMVYLSSSQETFGIGTCEAMAAGVPVLGWAWGGNLDIVRHMQTGYLAAPGDYDDLQRGLELCIANRREWGQAGRDDVLQRFTWPLAIEHCAGIYREAVEGRDGPRVSVIVPVYNLERFLPACLDSIKKQTSQDWECVIVDDNSPGNCAEIAAAYAREDGRFRYCRTPRNLYLAGARNHAIRTAARGRYILPLDCDDMLGERALEVMGDFLDKEHGYAIAYGAMEVLEEDGKRWVSGWPPQFKWELQLSKRTDAACNYNMLPYSSMYRRSVWERAGGYRERCITSEDNDFWCRATSFGSRAHKCTNYPTLVYRNRSDSMSHANAWPDCTLWYPWGRDRTLTPFGAVGEPSNKVSWPVKTFAHPRVSMIIPVGPGHNEVVRDALDSVLAQTVDAWEAIVVNDSGAPINLEGFPWVRYYETAEAGSGPAVARNTGIAQARAPLFALLDADDWLMPEFLAKCLDVHKEFGGYVYADWHEVHEDGSSEVKETSEFAIEDLLYKGLPWAITGLFRKADWELVGGFDPQQSGWEDWDFYFALATKEVCGTRIPEPLWCYRYWSGTRRESGVANGQINAASMRQKWGAYAANGGKKLMGCSGCGRGGGGRVSGGSNTAASKSMATYAVNLAQAAESGMVLMEYIGTANTTQTVRGPRSRQSYRVGGNNGHRQVFVYAVDAPQLEQLPFLRIVPKEAPPEAKAAEPLPVRQRGRVPDAVAN